MNSAQRIALRKIKTHLLHFGSAIVCFVGWIIVLAYGLNLIFQLLTHINPIPAIHFLLFSALLVICIASTIVYAKTAKTIKQIETESDESEV